MADRVLRVILTGDSKSLSASMAEADAATDAASDSMGGSVSKLGEDMEKTEGKSEGLISKLGNFMSNTGLPFSSAVKDMGEKLDETSTKGQHFSQAMSTAGGAILAVGVAAVVGIGAESLHMADKFDTAQAMMDTAITNAGGSVSKLTPALNKAYASAANLGFNMTDVAGAMQVLTTATNSPKKALGDLSLAEDLARMKGVSLSTASSALAKVYAGSNRALTQMGLNLDIGSAKLTSIRTATQAVETAQLGLKSTEEGIADGSIKAAQAGTALAAAHLHLTITEQNLKRDQGTVAEIMKVLTQRTHGAATAFGQTLPGQMDIAKAHMEDLGIRFGLLEEKGIKVVERGLVDVVMWFEKNSWAAKLLAGIIGTVLAGAVVTFAITKVSQFIGGAQKMAQGFGQMVSKIVGGSAVVEGAEEDVAATSEETSVATEGAFGPIGLAIAALGVIFILFHKHWKAIWDGIKDVAVYAWHFLDNIFHNEIAKDIMYVVFPATFLFTHWRNIWDGIRSIAVYAWHFLDNIFHNEIARDIMYVVSPLTYLATHWRQVWGIVKDVASDTWHFLDNDVVHPIEHAFDYVIVGSLNAYKRAWDFVWGAAKSTAKAAWHFIDSDIVQPVEKAFRTGIVGALNAVKAVWSTVWNGFKTVVNAVWSVLKPIFDTISKAISGIVSGIGHISHIAGTVGHVLSDLNPMKLLHLAGGGLVSTPIDRLHR